MAVEAAEEQYAKITAGGNDTRDSAAVSVATLDRVVQSPINLT